ncbi:hypothetical protein BC939DRAFT_500313 [Gamsiella multidivaricata]|uniref:uncharacterized protein n=1 Tax=Gamsiella multidivaricata TaxID=101098 RepID=UPI00221E869F|nr:uncharacterized protein BC939DRAFT_500313 [Gamsiella multidivaricata]KAI7829487.1 hypothetical protein BC939DRAFT_500313 [Gamsiella multidivaricata]
MTNPSQTEKHIQHLRAQSSPKTVKIPSKLDNATDERYIPWRHIQRCFKNVQYVTNDEESVGFMTDYKNEEIVPWRISYHPGIVLEAAIEDVHQGISAIPETASRHTTVAEAMLSEDTVAKRLGPLETHDAFQVYTLQIHMQILDELALLQNQVHAVRTLTYELHQYPIPRMFIVPRKRYDVKDKVSKLFAKQFRLFSLCDCGEHTMTEGTTILHEIHLVKHEGYGVEQLKGWIRIPCPDDHEAAQVWLYLEELQGINGGPDTTPGKMDLNATEALEGAGLRQLEPFLRVKDQNRIFSDLYQTITSQRHVKWVCLYHYRDN